MKTKTLLAIETSCDETSVAILKYIEDDTNTRFETLSHITLTQATMHAEYGGVYPNMARREHQINIVAVIAEALDKAGLLEQSTMPSADLPYLNYLEREPDVRPSLTDFVVCHPQPAINAIAVTTGPGLEPALWVGVNVARALADHWNIPVIPVNHMEGHILSVLAHSDWFHMPEIPLPSMALLISGGHTELVHINGVGDYTKLGQTRDDAIGEAFDKVARMMNLPYPGGPHISKLAAEYRLLNNDAAIISATDAPAIKLPRPMIHSGDLDFSFSGIKTATRYLIESLPKPLSPDIMMAIAHEFETAVTDVIVYKTKQAIMHHGIQSLIVAGGVSASAYIRSELTQLCESLSIPIFLPTGILAMDNALMIGIAGVLKLCDPTYTIPDITTIRADGNWSL